MVAATKEFLLHHSWWLLPAFVMSAHMNSLISLGISIVYSSVRERRLALHRPIAIYLIRHGQSEGNVQGDDVYRRIPDPLVPLTEQGKREAHELGLVLKQRLAGRRVWVYVSPYERARMTAEIALRQLAPQQIRQWSEDPRLREQEFAGGFQRGGRA
jgi:hypothetical protein